MLNTGRYCFILHSVPCQHSNSYIVLTHKLFNPDSPVGWVLLLYSFYTQGNSDLERLVGWLVQDHRVGEHESWFDSSCSDPRLSVVGLCAVQLHMASDPGLPPSEDSYVSRDSRCLSGWTSQPFLLTLVSQHSTPQNQEGLSSRCLPSFAFIKFVHSFT